MQAAAVVVIHALAQAVGNRQLGFGTGKAIVTAVPGWIPFAFIMAMLGMS